MDDSASQIVSNESRGLQIFCISDVHTEFGNAPVLPKCDVIVLAGDIGSIAKKSKLYSYLKYVSGRATHVIYVLGNHEFYGGALHTTVGKIRDAVVSMGIKNIRLLDNESVVIDGVEFFGTTLWSNIENHSFLQFAMNDYRAIRGASYARLTTYATTAVHKANVEWLDGALERSDAEVKIVVSHHMPLIVNDDACEIPGVGGRRALRFAADAQHLLAGNDRETPSETPDDYTTAFRTDLSWLMKKHSPKIWFYGHTHDSRDDVVGETRCVSNQYGYPGESVGYKSDKIIEV